MGEFDVDFSFLWFFRRCICVIGRRRERLDIRVVVFVGFFRRRIRMVFNILN